jgi:fructoselysine-6-P-deglycase FrlB-like protein
MEQPGTDLHATEVWKHLQGPVDDWLAFVESRTAEIGQLLRAPRADQERRGYRHTLREICQQPLTWVETASGMSAHLPMLRAALHQLRVDGQSGSMVLTGSGSSVYAGECLAPTLQAALGLSVRAVPAGEVLTHPDGYLPSASPCLIISFARSGNSPESCALLDSVRDDAPECRHLVITCNRLGRLATSYGGDSRVQTIVLDDKTCDRSLVMTSSFTNMVLAGRLLGLTDDLPRYRAAAEAAALLGGRLLIEHADALADLARVAFRSAVYLGSGCRYGSAREGALKMLEMTGGRVKTFPETYLGLRHGPMCAIDEGALVVCFLSADPVARAYETDLVRELNRKKLGGRKVLVGDDVPADLAAADDVVIETSGLVSDEEAPLVDAMAGQLLAFFRCLSAGLRPDTPSDDGVINRVVEDFAIHRRS